MFYVYILESLKDGKLYTGYTSNLKRRLERHNMGLVRSTQNRKPLKLVYYEAFSSRSEAMIREKYFKSPQGGREKIKLIANFSQEKLKYFSERGAVR
ncbi:GIY-YIG nuclease family protein [candidate division KSB1 bacterium]|nr:GIY-YIG nuclease family protein [candidate division KSB1 bacterium]